MGKRKGMGKRNVKDREFVADKRTVVSNRTVVDKKDLAFGRNNFILLAISAVIIIIGFILMSGPSSTVEKFNPDIFSAMRVKVAPLICFLGFVSMIVGVMYRPQTKDDDTDEIAMKEDDGLPKWVNLFLIIGGAFLFALAMGLFGRISYIGQFLLGTVGCGIILYGIGSFIKKKKK